MQIQGRKEYISGLKDEIYFVNKVESSLNCDMTCDMTEKIIIHIITKLSRILAIDSNNCFILDFKDRVAEGDYDYQRLYELDGGFYSLEEVINHVYIRIRNKGLGIEETLKPNIEVWLALLNK